MKPNEEDELLCNNLIAQLRLLILKGRVTQNRQSNENDINFGFKSDVSSGLHKEDFLSLWKSSESMSIEVWLHCSQQFSEQEAMEGHSGYLLLEQWHIKLKHNSNVESGFHCTENMLVQAIQSKLYFSQLSAWLNLTKGQFPRFTYLRLCRCDLKAPLQRFSKAAEFHQFPLVLVRPSKSLQVSLHSLPRFDIFQEYPMFTWVAGDSPAETPRKAGSTTSVTHDPIIATDKVTSPTTTQTVRKLDYSTPTQGSQRPDVAHGSATKAVAIGNQFDIFEKASVIECSEHACEISQNYLPPQRHLKHSDYSEKESDCALVGPCDAGKSISEKADDGGKACRHFEHSKYREAVQDVKCLKDNELLKFDSRKSSCAGLNHFGETVDNKCLDVCMCKHLEINSCEQIKLTNDRTKCCYPCKQTRTITSRDDFDLNELKPRDRIPDTRSQYPKMSGKTLSSSRSTAEHTERKTESHGSTFVLHVKPNVSRANDYKWTFCKKCSSRVANCSCDNRQSSKDEFRLENDSYISSGLSDQDWWKRARSKTDEACALDEKFTRVWPFVKDSEVLSGIRGDFGDLLPGIKDVFEEECSCKRNERLLKFSSSNGRFCDGIEDKEQKYMKTKDISRIKKEAAFHDQRSNLARHVPLRCHSRHASTGTLPVFHPRTGLPVSSSPAPLRKTAGLDTVDDTHSSTDTSFDLHSLSNALSKSAPTLTTQGLLGNFEESVLNNRLLPDGVVEGFTAELSASGSTKYLAHVTLPVQAYFFKLSDDNAPSPYMGYISLDVPELPRKGYHVPRKGTIQLTLFNPNQTVVKVFFVLYDFSDMKPKFQTFLRQKITSVVKCDGLRDTGHDNLHYLIHLRFASSKSGRIYLHTDIRLIFCRHPPDSTCLKTTTSGPTDPTYVPRFQTKD